MDDRTRAEPRPPQAEPRGMTLVDLIVLIIASALVIAVPGNFATRVSMGKVDPLAVMDVGAEALERSALALAVVIFARRVRYGGVSRPVQILLVFCAMLLLAEWVKMVPGLGDSGDTSSSRFWIERSADFGWPGLFLVYASVGKRIPGWAGLALLALAVCSFWGGDGYSLGLLGRFTGALGVREGVKEVILISVVVFVVAFIYGVPTAQVVLVPSGGRRTWVDWASLALAVPLLLLGTGLGLMSIVLETQAFPPSSSALVPAALGSLVLALLISIAVAWRQRIRVQRELVAG